jgi:dihydrofolate reductase
MRKLIVGAFVSLDGVMQAPGGKEEDPSGGFAHGGWVPPYFDAVFGEAMDALFAQPFDLLLGRKTYEIFAAYWPHQGDGDPIAKRFGEVTKYVAARSDTPLTWRKSVALRDAAADVARLKQESGPALLTQGSSDLIQTLLAHDLVDELRLLTFPVVLGGGKRLFGAGARPAAFELTDSKVSTTGVVISALRRAGPLATRDVDDATPTEAELARRRRMAREG